MLRRVLTVGAGVLALAVLLAAAVFVGVNIGRETGSKAPDETEQKTEQSEKPKPETKAKAAPKTSPELAVGETATLATGDTVTVYSYTPSVPPRSEFVSPKSGSEFSVIDAEACAGDTGITINPQSFALQMPDNSR